MNSSSQIRIFISAAETSGDHHAAKLIKTLKQDLPGINCDGIGGAAMDQQRCNLLKNIVDRSSMLAGAVSQIGFFIKLKRQIRHHFRLQPPDLVILVDSPAWNFHVAKEAKKLDIPVLYYIAPQLWAWGQWRLNKLKRLADKVACILPFEQQWFRERGVDAHYVGHPLFDDGNPIEPVSPWTHQSDSFPTIALLPGSRQQELQRLWPVMKTVAKRIKTLFPDAKFRTAASSDQNLQFLTQNNDPNLDIDIRKTGIEPVTRHADFCLVASGTATLEVAAQNCPMAIIYYVNPLQWHLIGKHLIKTPYLSLVNILAGRELVPEFMPFFHNQTERLTQTILSLLEDKQQLHNMRLDLRQLISPIAQPGASKNVSRLVQQMLPQF